jgi:hypothetical protein
MSELILPFGSSGGDQSSYIKSWINRLRPLLTFANLSQTDRDNLTGFVQDEVQKVFVDRKWDPEERLDYWRGNQISESTMQRNAEYQAIVMSDKQQADEWKDGIVRGAIPDGYTIDADDAQYLSAADKKFPRTTDVHNFNMFVQGVMIPRFYQKIRDRRNGEDGDAARIASMNPKK